MILAKLTELAHRKCLEEKQGVGKVAQNEPSKDKGTHWHQACAPHLLLPYWLEHLFVALTGGSHIYGSGHFCSCQRNSLQETKGLFDFHEKFMPWVTAIFWNPKTWEFHFSGQFLTSLDGSLYPYKLSSLTCLILTEINRFQQSAWVNGKHLLWWGKGKKVAWKQWKLVYSACILHVLLWTSA